MSSSWMWGMAEVGIRAVASRSFNIFLQANIAELANRSHSFPPVQAPALAPIAEAEEPNKDEAGTAQGA
ncbi:hypothetical protein H2248_004432 [Termitomyces sp. 'cryptogamus']|nr:hypothetical protein H2248_004430 [Termitomyces sp. 'cryptogamus']KAH0588605.1 hypothetical protein H2248_004432 [Termitomyces sp. 'cryptogamus']